MVRAVLAGPRLALADALELAAPIPLRDDVVPVLSGTTALPLTLEAAPLNRFLFCLTNTQYIQGPLDKVTEHGGGFDVYFAGRPKPEHYKKVVIRRAHCRAEFLVSGHPQCLQVAGRGCARYPGPVQGTDPQWQRVCVGSDQGSAGT